MKVGFIGLGSMGLPMARNLLRAGHSVTAHNRTPGRAEQLAGDGAAVAGSPSEAARGAEVVVTMLADDQVLRSVDRSIRASWRPWLRAPFTWE